MATKSKRNYDADIVGWYTRGGKRIPIRKSQSGSPKGVAKSPEKRYNKISKNAKALESPKYEDGTYDAETLKPVEYKNGYQVTYCQIGDTYTEAEHDALIEEFLKHSSDGKVSLGKFGGTPEHSFHFRSKEQAIKYAKEFNQQAIWDWETMDDIKIGGTGERKDWKGRKKK